MINYNELICPFVSGLKNPSSEKLVNPDNTINKEAIKAALTLGFPDITPRTMNDRNTEYKKLNKLEFADMPNALFDYCAKGQSHSFGNLLTNWFKKNHTNWKEDFEILHANACSTVQSFLEDQLYGDKSCTYGKAQKVVNMTFKHLYCLSEGKKREWFLNCHMALDFFTLEWFKRKIAKYGSVYPLGKVDNWSALQNPKSNEYKGKNGSNFYSYHFFVEKIREYFKEERPFGPLCPLEAEFIIWPDIQTRLCAESFLYQLDPEMYSGNGKQAKAHKQAVKELSIDALLAEVKSKIAQYRDKTLPLIKRQSATQNGTK